MAAAKTAVSSQKNSELGDFFFFFFPNLVLVLLTFFQLELPAEALKLCKLIDPIQIIFLVTIF